MNKIAYGIAILSILILIGCQDGSTGGALRSLTAVEEAVVAPTPIEPISGGDAGVCGDGVTSADELCDYSNSNDPYTQAGVCTTACRIDGSPGGWQGCRGNGKAVCTELVPIGSEYWALHPLCDPNPTCAGVFYTCNNICPAPDLNETNESYCGDGVTDQDEICDYANQNDPYVLAGACTTACWVDGSPGGWQGCRGNGKAVCTELVPYGDDYWDEHPLCTPNPTCAGQFYTCNNICPEPEAGNETNTTCNDYDGGVNIFEKGFITGIDKFTGEYIEAYDYCYISGQGTAYSCDGSLCGVHEYACGYWDGQNVVTHTYYPCSFGCYDGACNQNQTNETDTTPPTVTGMLIYADGSNTLTARCNAYDFESGIDYVESKIQKYNDQYGFWGEYYFDSYDCNGMANCNTAVPYQNPHAGLYRLICNGVNMQGLAANYTNNSNITVPEISEFCFDSDPNNNFYVWGYVNLTNSTYPGGIMFEDDCGSGDETVIQYGCNDDYQLVTYEDSCLYSCENGVCLENTTNQSEDCPTGEELISCYNNVEGAECPSDDEACCEINDPPDCVFEGVCYDDIVYGGCIPGVTCVDTGDWSQDMELCTTAGWRENDMLEWYCEDVSGYLWVPPGGSWTGTVIDDYDNNLYNGFCCGDDWQMGENISNCNLSNESDTTPPIVEPYLDYSLGSQILHGSCTASDYESGLAYLSVTIEKQNEQYNYWYPVSSDYDYCGGLTTCYQSTQIQSPAEGTYRANCFATNIQGYSTNYSGLPTIVSNETNESDTSPPNLGSFLWFNENQGIMISHCMATDYESGMDNMMCILQKLSGSYWLDFDTNFQFQCAGSQCEIYNTYDDLTEGVYRLKAGAVNFAGLIANLTNQSNQTVDYPPAGPDLVVLYANYTAFYNGTPGGNIDVAMRNIGDAPTTTYSYVLSQLNITAPYNGTRYFAQNLYVPILSNVAGSNTYIARHGIYEDLPYGNQTYFAYADITYRVNESNENNNWLYTGLWTYP